MTSPRPFAPSSTTPRPDSGRATKKRRGTLRPRGVAQRSGPRLRSSSGLRSTSGCGTLVRTEGDCASRVREIAGRKRGTGTERVENAASWCRHFYSFSVLSQALSFAVDILWPQLASSFPSNFHYVVFSRFPFQPPSVLLSFRASSLLRRRLSAAVLVELSQRKIGSPRRPSFLFPSFMSVLFGSPPFVDVRGGILNYARCGC